MQDEVNEKVVSLAIKTSKLTAEVLQKAMKALLAKGKGQLTKAPHGKITMRQLMKQGEKVSNIEITDQNIKAFDPIARKSGLDYNVKKIENGKPPTYLVSFKGKDIDVMTEAFREFTAKKLGRDKKPSISTECLYYKACITATIFHRFIICISILHSNLQSNILFKWLWKDKAKFIFPS